MSIPLSLHPYVCPSLSIHPFLSSRIHPSAHPPVSLPTCLLLSIRHFFFSPSVIISTCLSVSLLFIHPSILLPICLSPTLSSVYPCVHPSSIYLVVAACQPPSQGWRSTSKPDRALAMRELKCPPNLRLSFHISPYLGSEVIQRCPDTLPGNF